MTEPFVITAFGIRYSAGKLVQHQTPAPAPFQLTCLTSLRLPTLPTLALQPHTCILPSFHPATLLQIQLHSAPHTQDTGMASKKRKASSILDDDVDARPRKKPTPSMRNHPSRAADDGDWGG